ncbi:MAG: type I-D CRISPR-associated helicase Cas3' [Acaryochloris sp. RU_4_1]|nr:type I-D CRISPR-associated helicase Cas3' [Acaryochloris sp. RU_4_1]
MLINLQPLYSRLADTSAKAGISWHQQATWDALSDRSIDVVINTALSGDGKSYAAFGAFPSGGVMALYPTNELVRDQQRQLNHYQNQWRVQRVTGFDLERWASMAKQSKAETLLDLSDAEVLLTNPDLFYYLHQGNYLKDFLRQGGDGRRAVSGHRLGFGNKSIGDSKQLFLMSFISTNLRRSAEY